MRTAAPADVRERLLRVAPFAMAAIGSLPLTLLPPANRDPVPVIVAAVTSVAVVAVLALGRLPAPVRVAALVGYVAAVAVLSHAEGGAGSGFAWLLVLAVVWAALHESATSLGVVLVGSLAALVVPRVALGAPAYRADDWRSVLVYAAVLPVVAGTVHHLARTARARAAEAAERNEALAASEYSLMAVAAVVRELSHRPDVRDGICQAVLDIADATFAAIVEPDGQGHLVSTATAGVPVQPIRLMMGYEPSGAVVAFASRQPFFVPDASGHPAVSQRLLHLTAGRSALFEPILRSGRSIGVLVAVWGRRVEALSDTTATTLRLLAAETALAIERANANDALRNLARTDDLTGLPNRRAFEDLLRREMARGRRVKRPLALAMLDLDQFKAFNDTWGHQVGDRLLTAAASAWQPTLREADVLARWGGEEFALILPDAGLDTAVNVVERMRAVTPQEQTCSAGLAVWDGTETLEGLVERADRALYRAKEAGRDRTIVSPMAVTDHSAVG